MSEYYGGNPQTIESPITQSGRVIINGVKDMYDIGQRENAAQQHAECFSLLTHELAFHRTNRDHENALYRDSRVPVITCFNGAKETDRYTFVGIIGSRALHDPKNRLLNEEDTTLQIGGLCTVMNNGDTTFKVGDYVSYKGGIGANGSTPKQETNNKNVLGVPRMKQLAQITALTTTSQVLVGRAMSSSRPGQPLDMLLA
jgi:hypothetical protein